MGAGRTVRPARGVGRLRIGEQPGPLQSSGGCTNIPGAIPARSGRPGRIEAGIGRESGGLPWAFAGAVGAGALGEGARDRGEALYQRRPRVSAMVGDDAPARQQGAGALPSRIAERSALRISLVALTVLSWCFVGARGAVPSSPPSCLWPRSRRPGCQVLLPAFKRGMLMTDPSRSPRRK